MSEPTDRPPAESRADERRRWLTPNVIRLSAVSFFADVSSEMLYPLIPVFLTTVLGAPVAVVGLIEGVAEATASIMKTVSGRLSDRSGRRKALVFSGYTLSALGKPIIAVAAAWPLALVGRVVDRFGKGLRDSPRDALLADSSDAEFRGKVFGWHRAADTMGAVVGPLIALAMLALLHENLRLIIGLAVIPGAIGALLVLLVKEIPPKEGTREAAARVGLRELPRPFRAYLGAWAIFAIANSSDVFLILRAQQDGYGPTGVVLLYVLYNAVYALSSPGLGTLSDRLGRRTVILGGLLVFALVYLGFAFVRVPAALWVLFAVYGLYVAATDGVGKAFAIDLVPESLRASAVGVLGTVTGLCTLVASTTAGLLWTAVGPWAAFVFGSVGAVASAVVFAMSRSLRGR